MSKLTKFLFVLWIILAITGFVGAFFITPIYVKIPSVIFGILNIAIIMSWCTSLIAARREYKRQQKIMEG